MEPESKQERDVREQLESLLTPDEPLLAFTSGQIASAFSQAYHLGLTADRLLFVPPRRRQSAGTPISVWHAGIQALQLERGNLKVKFETDQLTFRVRQRNWKRRAQHLVETSAALRLAAAPLSAADVAQQRQRQADDLVKLGLIGAAFDELTAARQLDPALTIDPAVSRHQEQIGDRRFALRVAAAFLFVSAAVTTLFILLGLLNGGSPTSSEFISAGIDILIGVNLWRGRTLGGWRAWALLRVVIGTILIGIAAFTGGSYVDLALQLAFGIPNLLVLTGSGNRTRTYVAIGIFIIGYVGGLVGIFLLAALGIL